MTLLRRAFPVLVLAATMIAVSSGAALAQSDAAARVLLDRSIARMGGDSALRAVRSIRLDMMTQWQRTNFSTHPSADYPSYERNVELRDYATNAWRNTRTFLPGTSSSVDIVSDTVGARSLTAPDGRVMHSALNIAYVQERRELFNFAPERTLLLAREAKDLRALRDTTIDGVAHGRVAATVDGFPATWFLRRTDGLLAMVRFRANEDADFGLAPWGDMDVEFWYSGWVRYPPGVLIPRQRDVRRVGRPYKRMTAMMTMVNPSTPPDSFAIADSMVRVYLDTQRRSMWDVSLDTIKLVDQDFVVFPQQLGSFGAVRVGGRWVVLETGQAKGAGRSMERWFARVTPESPVGAGIVANTSPSNGGVAWMAEKRLPVYVAPGAVANVRAMLGTATAAARATSVTTNGWVKVGNDSLWLEVVHAPDTPGTLAVYSPTHRWLYAPMLIGRPPVQSDVDAVIARLKARGLVVEWLGSARALRSPVPK